MEEGYRREIGNDETPSPPPYFPSEVRIITWELKDALNPIYSQR